MKWIKESLRNSDKGSTEGDEEVHEFPILKEVFVA